MFNVSRLNNEGGYLAILAALVMLTLITIIGIWASRVSNTEAAMARNEAIYKRNFYLAEGAALEAADHLTRYGNLPANLKPWMEMVTGNLDVESLRLYWDNSTSKGDTVIPEPSTVDPNHTRFLIGDEGIAPGSSLDMGKSSVHAIGIYSRCEWDGVAIIKMGFRAAY